MKDTQNLIEEQSYDDGVLTPEEHVWFPNILRYLQERGTGDGKRGRLQRGHTVVLQDFLPEADLAALLAYTLDHEASFRPSQIIKGEKDTSASVRENSIRRSVIMTKMEQHYKEVMKEQIDKVLPDVLRALEIASFPCGKKEYQLTASNDGEFFRLHTDASLINRPEHSRVLSYVYYFYREPKAFTGGELRVYDTIMVDDYRMAALNAQTIIPQQNQIVFFPSVLLHEVLQISCPTQEFAASRFTFNGWLHQLPKESSETAFKDDQKSVKAPSDQME